MLPKTAVGERARAFIEAFNSGMSAKLEKFFAANVGADAAKQVPPAARAARLMDLRRDMGVVTIKKVEVPSPDDIVLYIAGNQGRLLRLGLMFGSAPEHFLRGISVDEADAADLAGQLPPMTRAEALSALEKAVDEAVAADDFSGVVLVAHRPDQAGPGNGAAPLLLKAWGLANKSFGVPNRTDTKFNLGSINKIFTRVAVTQLIERGKISLDDKLGKFLADYPNADARDKVTIRELLDMKSGIGDFFGEKFEATPKDRFRSNVDFLAMFADRPLAFEPGTQQQYSNGGYTVLGEIIARVSGMDYYDYVRKNIFEPAGMTNSDSYEADVLIPNLAEGYTRHWSHEEEGPGARPAAGAPARRSNIYTRPARGSAAGGGYSTAEDMLRFANALTANKLLSPAYTEWVLTGVEPGTAGAPKPPTDRETPAGGPKRKAQIGPGPRGPRGGLGIAGGAPGINAALELDLETGYVVIVMANYDPPAAVNIAKKARRFLAAVKPAAGPR